MLIMLQGAVRDGRGVHRVRACMSLPCPASLGPEAPADLSQGVVPIMMSGLMSSMGRQLSGQGRWDSSWTLNSGYQLPVRLADKRAVGVQVLRPASHPTSQMLISTQLADHTDQRAAGPSVLRQALQALDPTHCAEDMDRRAEGPQVLRQVLSPVA